MGLYDRDYYRDHSQPGLSLRTPQTAIGWIILINLAVWLVGSFFFPNPGHSLDRLASWLALGGDTLWKPWLWWNMVSYGFAHAPAPSHILFNMLGLFILGRDIEWTYGKREFILLYLALIFAGGLVWSVASAVVGDYRPVVGASGAVAGIVVLYAMHFPRRTLLLFFVIPIPAWVLGVLLVMGDLLGALGHADENVAYLVHLAGAGFAFLYYKFGWRFERMGAGLSKRVRQLRSPRLKVRRPEEDESDENFTDEVDRILEKISREGEASLTRRERRALQDASRRYQDRLR